MSYQSIDMDELNVFSNSSRSPQCADSTVGLYDQRQHKRLGSASSLTDEGPLYESLFLSDISKQEDDKGDSQDDSNSLDSIVWPNEFFSAPVSTSRRTSLPSHRPPTTSGATASLKRSFNLSSCVDGIKSSKEKEKFSDAYDRVDFDLPQRSRQFDSKSPRSAEIALGMTASDVPGLSNLPSSSLDSLLDINRPCFEAAVKEHYGKKKKTTEQYVTKMKERKGKQRSLSSSQAYDKQHQCQSPPLQTHLQQHKQELAQKLKTELQKRKCQKETVETVVSGHVESMSTCPASGESSMMTRTSFSMFTMPSMPPVSPPSTCVLSPSFSDDQSSAKTTKSDVDIKKHRYNQTALALQQSGLMKITIKTAELLRKSRTLQQELSKLRRETSLFVQAVLSNPENKHLKDLYMAQQKNESVV